MIRLLDILFSVIGILLLLPVFIIVLIVIKLDSKGPVFYCQKRVGKEDKDFVLYKFRTMFTDADKHGLLTVGCNDSRITKCGLFLRKYKMDELPQLINVLIGNMSLVGPRPEVRKYVNLYTKEQRSVLQIKPGVTDLASIIYKNESELLLHAVNPEQTYIQTIMPDKIRLNMKYINNPSIVSYFRITFKTLLHIIKK